MNWKPDKGKPICPQLCEQICLAIAVGTYGPGGRLPSVRELAAAIGVNPNTVQHAMETLELQGVLVSVRCNGWYVAEDISPAQQTLSRLREDKTAVYFQDMISLGMTAENIKQYVKEWEYE